MEPDQTHYRDVARALLAGEVVPFFGAGVNLCERAKDEQWEPGRTLPSGGELTEDLVDFAREELRPIATGDAGDLARVSLIISTVLDNARLYGRLRSRFDADFPTTTLHNFFAGLPVRWGNEGEPPPVPPPLIVTTNYDDVMERAYEAAEVPFDLVTYEAEKDGRGRFGHRPPGLDPDAPSIPIDKPNEYAGLLASGGRFRHPVVLKIHGTVDRRSEDRDTYVITEDDYIDYLARTDLTSFIPIALRTKLKKGRFLFLGYRLRDWNLRVVLRRLWDERPRDTRSWAVQKEASSWEKEYWGREYVQIVEADLKVYVAELQQHVEKMLAERLAERRTERRGGP